MEGRPRLCEIITSLLLDASALNDLLSDYGRFLWWSGQAYWKNSETLDVVTRSDVRSAHCWDAPGTLHGPGGLWSPLAITLPSQQESWALQFVLHYVRAGCDAHRCRLGRTTEACRVSARLSLRHRLAHEGLNNARTWTLWRVLVATAHPNRRTAHHGPADQCLWEFDCGTTFVASISLGFSNPFQRYRKGSRDARDFHTWFLVWQRRHFPFCNNGTHPPCCSAWPLDESENNEHLPSGSPGIICPPSARHLRKTSNLGSLREMI